MKKTMILRFLMIILILTPVIASAQQTGSPILIDGKLIEFTSESGYPFLDENGRTQVPFRVTLEAFEAKVDWDQSKRTAIAEKDGIRVEVPIGEKYIIVNGQRVENDTAAVIVESKTYLPIRKVMESFRAEVSWNDSTRAVNITSSTSKIELSKELQESIKVLENKIIFDNDIAVFTLYAFLNFTGYDEENNQQGYHEVRKMIREDLEKMNLSLRDNNYYTNKKVAYHYYRQVLTKMDGAPNFRVSQSLPNYLTNLNDLESHLIEFYEKANIEELFEKYNSHYQKELDKYSGPIYPILAKTNQFLRVNTNEIPEFYFQVNLLDAYWRGFGLGSTYEHKGGKGIIITGPSDKANLKNVVHEYLHGIITPISNEIRREIEELSFLMAKVPQNTQASSSSYNNWFAVFDESLIRALDSTYLDEGSDYIQNEMRNGFILAEYFNERFNEFESYEGTLKEFIKQLVADIKAENK